MFLLLQISQSNARTVALRDVRRNLTGFYKCEVSADAPLFHTEIKSGLMIVVVYEDEMDVTKAKMSDAHQKN
ncbi:hypothetical protein C0J52_24778 [Blattella germanica]|nr:hypothetical protein C0J52_24778 [Blattella germanica]